MYDQFPTYQRYRTLKLTSPPQVGEDVYALQTALAAVGHDVGTHDGVLGKLTAAAITAAQHDLGVSADGLAGGKTQEALALRIARKADKSYGLAEGLLRGQLEHESGFRLGNYSPQRSDGSYDAGVAQRNTAHTPARQGFDVPDSIDALGVRVRQHFDLFNGVSPVKRRWQLAQGAWNAPAFACYLARQAGATKVTAGMCSKPGTTAHATLEAYIASVSTYLVV